MKSRTPARWVAAAVIAVGCSADLSIPDGVAIACGMDGKCPSGYFCRSQIGRCLPAGAGDTLPAVESFRTNAQLFGVGGVIEVALTVDAALSLPPTVTLQMPGVNRQASLVSESALSYAFQYVVIGQDPEGLVSIGIDLVDTNGSPARVDYPNELQIDKTPPALGVKTLMLSADPSNLQRLGVESATVGTMVEISFAVTEPLQGSPTVVATELAPIGVAGEVTFEARTEQDPFYIYEAVIPHDETDGISDGIYAIHITAVDKAGNETVPALTDDELTFEIDTESPPPPTQVRFTRVPWGCEAYPDPIFALDGSASVEPNSAVVALSSADPVTRLELGRTLSDSTGSFGLNELFALNTADRSEVYVLALDEAGNQSEAVLAQRGRWIGSLRNKVAGQKDNPNTFWTLAVAQPALDSPQKVEPAPDLMRRLGAAQETADEDGVPVPSPNVEVTATRFWQNREQHAPAGTYAGSMAFVSASGKAVMFGGTVAERFQNTVWEWNGVDWRAAAVEGQEPVPMLSAALAYDWLRNRVIVFGGLDETITARDETWEWDGNKWQNVSPAGASPPGRLLAALAFDSTRGQVVLFGGAQLNASMELTVLGDTWVWDGVSWSESTQNGSGPDPRYAHTMAYDPNLQRVVLFGGLAPQTPTGGCADGGIANNAGQCPRQDTWHWDGSAWSEVTPSHSPSARFAHIAAYSDEAGGIVLFGGCNDGELLDCIGVTSETWLWNGSNWSELVTAGAGPAARGYAAATYDTARRLLLVNGGVNSLDEVADPDACAGCGEDGLASVNGESAPYGCTCEYAGTWALSGGAWQLLSQASDRPEANDHLVLAYDRSQGRTVLFGGTAEDDDCEGSGHSTCVSLWEWDGTVWKIPAQAQGAVQPVDCMAYDDTVPWGRYGHALAYLPDTGGGQRVILMFGGATGLGAPCDCQNELQADECVRTWKLNLGSDPSEDSWEVACDPDAGCSSPPSRKDTAMVEADAKIYMFGGQSRNCPGSNEDFLTNDNNGCRLSDLWRYDSAGWTQIVPAGPPTTWPEPRFGHAMAYDQARQRLVLFGGCKFLDDDRCPEEDDPLHPNSALDDTWVFDIALQEWFLLDTGSVSPSPRLEHTMVYDSTRARIVLFGGGEGDGRRTNVPWELNASTWKPLPVVPPAPTARRGHGMAYDSARKVVVVVGDGAPKEVWEWDLGDELRPAGVFEFAFDSAHIARENVARVAVTIVATGTGYATDTDGNGDLIGDTVEGLSVAGWSAETAAWETLSCSPETPNGRRTCDLASAELKQRYVFPGNHRVYVRLTPSAGSGNGPELASLAVDYAEVTIEYVLGASKRNFPLL